MSSIEVILVKSMPNIGPVGFIAKLKAGYARYLIIKKIAIRNTKENFASFEQKKIELEKLENETIAKAYQIKEKLDLQTILINANADDYGNLYGSIGGKEIGEKCKEIFSVEIFPEALRKIPKFKTISSFPLKIELYHGIFIDINVVIENSISDNI